jgi:NADH-quinone oxidoreductase subunit G
MPELTIDGRTVSVGSDQTILQAAKELGIEIPTFCFHDGLSIAANCRICLVEVEGMHKPVPACEVRVREGMVVHTNSPVAEAARKGVLEFILLNHPVDCPICDCAGECVLQDHYHEHSAEPSRINIKKVRKGKTIHVGPHVMLDQERCINCTRCVRFLKEVTGSEQLTQVQRGVRTEIALFPETTLDDPYSLCVVDLCPVGALTSLDFRFKKRAWWLKYANSICPDCSRGCNVRVDHCDNTIWRLVPRHNDAVNRWWMCDEGRLGFHRFQSDRVVQCHLRPIAGEEAKVTADEAVARAGAELAEQLDSGGRIAPVISAFASNEEAYALFTFCLEVLGLSEVYLGIRKGGQGDKLLRTADRNPNKTGIQMMARKMGLKVVPLQLVFSASAPPARAILSLGTEYELPVPPEGTRLESAVVFAVRQEESALRATVVFPIPSHFEKSGSYVNCDGQIQQAQKAVQRPAEARPVHLLLRQMAGAMGKAISLGQFKEVRKLAAEVLSRKPKPPPLPARPTVEPAKPQGGQDA